MTNNQGYSKKLLRLRLLFSVMDKTIAKGMSTSYVAKRILRAVEYAESEVVIAPLSNKLAIVIRALSPSLYFKIMEHRANSQRDGEEIDCKNK